MHNIKQELTAAKQQNTDLCLTNSVEIETHTNMKQHQHSFRVLCILPPGEYCQIFSLFFERATSKKIAWSISN